MGEKQNNLLRNKTKKMTDIMKTPTNTSIAKLTKLRKIYEKPANSMEAFILYAIKTELKARDAEHAKMISPDSLPDEVVTMEESEQFEDNINE